MRLLDEADGDDPAVRVELLNTLSFEARTRGDTAAQLAHSLEQARIAEPLGDPDLLVKTLNSLAIALLTAGSPTAYRAVVTEAVVLAREARVLVRLVSSLSNLCSELYPSDLARADALGREAVETGRQLGDAFMTEVALINACFTWWLTGDWDDISRHVSDWLEDREASGNEAALRLAQVQVAVARDEPLPALPTLPDSDDPWEQYSKDLLLALVDAAAGDLAGAAAAARVAALRTFGNGVMIEDVGPFAVPAVELQLRAGDLEAAEEVLGTVEPIARDQPVPLLTGEVARLRGTITAARGGDPEADLRAAEATHAAYTAPYPLARTRHELARWLVAQGRVEEARVLVAQAREAYAALGAVVPLTELSTLLRTSPVG